MALRDKSVLPLGLPRTTARSERRWRQGQNEGTLYKRQDGRWEGALTIPDSGGKRKRFYGDTQKVVREQVTAR